MDIIPLLLGSFGFIILLMTPFEAQTLRQTAKRGGGHLRLSLALLLAFGINTAGITTFFVVFIGLGFGVPNRWRRDRAPVDYRVPKPVTRRLAGHHCKRTVDSYRDRVGTKTWIKRPSRSGLTIHSSRRRFAARLNSGVRPHRPLLSKFAFPLERWIPDS